jgi:hypothetical protein
MISIDGKARREGTTLAQAVSGTYFGPDSELNGAPCSVPQTARTVERAIIHAANSAVDKAAMVIVHGAKIQKVIIMTHCDWLVTHMNDKIWEWLAYGFRAEEQLPAGVSPEEYKLAHHIFRQLEEKNIAVLFWKVAEHLIPEPGRLANDHLDLLERDCEEQYKWQTSYARHLFMMMIQQMMLEEAEAGENGGRSSDSGQPCPCPNCGPVMKEIAEKSREEEWRRGEENDCPCADCREFAGTHGNPKKNLAMKDTGKESQKFAQSSDSKSDGNGVQKPSKRVKTEHAAAG